MVKTVCRYLFSSSRNKEEKHWGTLKKKTAPILSSESVNILIRGVVAAVRVVKNHSKITSFAFITICFHSAFTVIRF